MIFIVSSMFCVQSSHLFSRQLTTLLCRIILDKVIANITDSNLAALHCNSLADFLILVAIIIIFL